MPTIPRHNRKTLAVKSRKQHIDQKKKAFAGIDTSNKHIYNSAQWKRTRKIVLHSQPLCVKCKEKNIYKAANTIDHIVPLNQGGQTYALNNLQALCSSCHNRKSSYDRGKGDINT